MAKRAFLFDLDGTLWKGYEWYSRVLSEEVQVSEEEILDDLLAGRSVLEISRALSISRARLFRVLEEKVHLLKLYPRVPQSLQELHSRGHKLGVVTDLSGGIALPALRARSIEAVLSGIVHPGIIRARKPSPKPLLKALDIMGIGRGDSRRAAYVGDAPRDAESSVAAGIPFAWASYGYSQEEPVGASYTLGSFEEVLLI